MRRLVIAVDCDDVLLPAVPTLIEEYNRRHNTRVQVADAFVRDNHQWQADRYTVLDRLRDIQNSEIFVNIEPFEEAREVLQRIGRKHELHLVTARDIGVSDTTAQMINVHFAGCFSALEHVGDGSKGMVCKRIEADLLIDDNYRHLIDAHSHGTDGLIWFGDYEWQIHDKAKFSGHEMNGFIRECRDWLAIEKEIERFAAS